MIIKGKNQESDSETEPLMSSTSSSASQTFGRVYILHSRWNLIAILSAIDCTKKRQILNAFSISERLENLRFSNRKATAPIAKMTGLGKRKKCQCLPLRRSAYRIPSKGQGFREIPTHTYLKKSISRQLLFPTSFSAGPEVNGLLTSSIYDPCLYPKISSEPTFVSN